MNNIFNKIDHILYSWVNTIQKSKYLVISASLILSLICSYYTINNIGINTDTKDMLSEDLAWRKLDVEFDNIFPQYSNNLLIVVESNIQDDAIDAAKLLYERLALEKDFFNSVYYPQSLPYFLKSALLFLETDELQDLGDNLAAMQPFLSKLVEDNSIPGLFDMLGSALEAINDGEEVDLDPLIKQLNETLNHTSNNHYKKISWHSLISGKKNDKNTYREFIITQPILDNSGLLTAKNIINEIKKVTSELKKQNQFNIEIKLTGSVALSHDELSSVSSATKYAVAGALLIVTGVLFIGLGSLWLVIFTLITLVTGLIYTAAFATLTVGELNLISVAFAVLYIGLGVDFAIHFCLRYRELIQNNNNLASLQKTVENIGGSLLVCALTTALGFFSFLPTDYDGIAELGWISGFGMFISFFTTMTLLPALLCIFPLDKNLKRNRQTTYSGKLFVFIRSFPVKHAKIIRLVTPVLIFLCLCLVPFIKFDINTLNLQSKKYESVKTYYELLDDSDTSPWSSITLADNKDSALNKLDEINKLDAVDHSLWIYDFIPEDQETKLLIIDDMNLLLGDLAYKNITKVNNARDNYNVYINSINQLINLINETSSSDGLLLLKMNLQHFLTKLAEMEEISRIAEFITLEKALLDSFPGRFSALKASLDAELVDEENIPEQIYTRWVSSQGKYLIEIFPVKNLSNNDDMKDFVNAIQNIIPDAIGSPIISVEAGKVVVSAFQQAFISALVAISFILFLLLRNLRETVITLLPILLAALLTAAICVIFNIPINFANIIALPLLLGIGVDSSIHMIHRYKTAPPADGLLLGTSSSRAVLVSALTTITSIGNLSFSPHLGTASMGILLTIGITMTLLCTLIVLPGYLEKFSNE